MAAVDPVTGVETGRVAVATAADVDEAVSTARRALGGEWGRMGVGERLAVLRRVADEVDARREAFTAAEIADTGKPLGLVSRIDIPRGAANFRAFADAYHALSDEVFFTDRRGDEALNYTVRSPAGVIGVICPWNLPLLLMTWKVAPALAAGCTVVVKPSEETPRTATLLAEAMKAAGVPDGVYNVVHGGGAGACGEFLCAHSGLDAITFTGESATGQSIMRAAATGLKRVSFELGGKNPALIFADADLEAAIEGTARSVFTNSGQVCLCTERVYVERSVFEPFVAGLVEAGAALSPGSPWAPETTMGPLISETHRRKVLGYYRAAIEEGAMARLGGGVPSLGGDLDGGFFIEPTILTGLPETSPCVREEIFGPVCHVQPFDSEASALKMANDSPYGLCATVWTRDVGRAHRLARQLDVGLTWVNAWYLRDLRTPFGGNGQSGIGREGGVHSFDFYTQLKNICVKMDLT